MLYRWETPPGKLGDVGDPKTPALETVCRRAAAWGLWGRKPTSGDPGLQMFPGMGLFKGGRRAGEQGAGSHSGQRLRGWGWGCGGRGRVRAAGPARALQEAPTGTPPRLSLLFEKGKAGKSESKNGLALC